MRFKSLPVTLFVAALTLNVLQLLTSPFEKLADTTIIKGQLLAGARSFSTTRFGNCDAQLSYLATNISNADLVTVGGIRWVFGVELMLLVAVFSIVFLVWNRTARLLELAPECFSIKHSLIAGLVLLLVDQIRYLNTSVFKVEKNFYTWSSYCFHGDLAWLFDVLAYAPLYFGLGAAITIFWKASNRVKSTNADIHLVDLGLGAEHKAISGTMAWTSAISIFFFVVWLVGTRISPSSSVFYAAQATLIYGLILLLVLYSGFRALRLNQWYDTEVLKVRKSLAKKEGVDVAKIGLRDLEDEGIKPNPFAPYIGPHGTSFGKLVASVVIPIFGYLGQTSDAIQRVADVFKAVSGSG